MNTDKIYAQNIANEYAPKNASKVVALNKLDKKAKQPAKVFSYTFGIVSSLVLGAGMCLCMGVIGNNSVAAFVAGIVVGLLGIAGLSTNYLLYQRLLEKGKKRYGSDIIRLASEIAGEA